LGGAVVGAGGAGAAYEYNAYRQMQQLEEDYKAERLSRAEYEKRKQQISQTEVTYYGTNIIDRLNSASVWGSAQLGLSLVRLRSLGHRRDDINYRPDSIPVGPDLKVLSVVRPSGWLRHA